MQRINLLSADMLPQREVLDFQRALWIVPLFAIVLLAIAFYQRSLLQQERGATAAARASLQQVLDQISQVSRGLPPVRPLLSADELQARLQERQTFLASLQRSDWSHNGFSRVLQSLAEQTDNGIWLTSIHIDAQSVKLKGGTIAPDKLPDWLARLQQQSSFTPIQFAHLQLQRPEDKPFLAFDVQGSPP